MGIVLNRTNSVTLAVPIGTVIESACPIPPTNYLLADGSAISRITFADLFEVIGTTYGVGDGVTTFNLPDRRGNVGRGAGTSVGYAQNVTIAQGVKTDDALQGHFHRTYVDGVNGSSAGGLGNVVNNGNEVPSNSTREATSDGTNGTPRTANETRVKSLGMKYFIKYQ